MRSILVLVATVVALVFSHPVLAEGLSGRVVDAETNAALEGALVEELDTGGERVRSTLASADGRFSLPEGSGDGHRLRVSHVGYRPVIHGVAELPRKMVFGLTPSMLAGEEIVVSASRYAENILSAPISIAKVDGAEIHRAALGASYSSLLDAVKGIDYTQVGLFDERFNARGYNEAFNTRMVVLTDGRLSRTGGGHPLYGPTLPKDDLRDIEVIVGPGSALYGPDAINGVVSLRSKGPREFDGTSIALSGGNRSIAKGRFRHAGMMSGPWGYKVAADYQRGNSWGEARPFTSQDGSRTILDNPDFTSEFQTVTAGIYYYPKEDGEWSLTSGLTMMDQVFLNPIARSQTKGYVNYFTQLKYSDENWYINLYRAGDDSRNTFSLNTRASLIAEGLPRAQAEEMALDRSEWAFYEGEARYSQKHALGRATVGASFRHDESTGLLFEGGKASARLFGAYAQVDVVPSSWLQLSLAGRYDEPESYASQFSPKVGLVVKPMPTLAFRGTYNRAYKSPTLSQQFALLPIFPGLTGRGNGAGFQFASLTGGPLPAAYAAGVDPLVPEDVETFEVGFKGIFSDRAFVDVSLYRSHYQNFISGAVPISNIQSGVVIVDATGAPVLEETLSNVNFGAQNVKGVDVGVNVYASDRVVLSGNASFLDADALEDARGLTQPFNTPRAIVKLGTTWRDALVRGMTVGLAGRAVSAYDFRSGVLTGRVPAFQVYDLDLSFRTRSGLTYRASIKNLLDHNHVEFGGGPEIGLLVVGEFSYEL
jgi:outer membrane receptor for ferrienterochelin and colicins